MPTITKKRPPGGQRNAPFDWDIFLDGKQRTCKQGKDFFGLPANFQHRARHAAQRRGCHATTWTEGTDVVVQFEKPDGK